MQEEKNFFTISKKIGLKPWQNPLVLFAFLSFLIIGLILYIVFRFVLNPAEAISTIALIAVVIFFFGCFFVSGFNRMVEANQMKTDLVYIASHQMKTPLTILRWTLDLMEKKKDGKYSPENLDLYIKALRGAQEKMNQSVSSFLDIGRIEAGTVDLNKEIFSLVELVKGEIGHLKNFSTAAGIGISFKGLRSLPPVLADKARVAMAIQNLIDNAIQYSDKKGKIDVLVEKQNGHFLKLSVTDHGFGIRKEQQKYIFKKFFHIDKAGIKKTGTGLGLYIVKLIVEVSGGEIGFFSEEGEGSTFWFTLPIAQGK